MSEQSNSQQTEDTIKREAVEGIDLDAMLDREVKLTGADLPAGSYPGVLFAFGAPFKMRTSEKFKKPGAPEYRVLFDLRFGLFDKGGDLVELTAMAGVPDGGEVNRRSNLYKYVKGLAPESFDKEGNFKPGLKLSALIGRTCILNVTINKKEFPQIEGISPPLDGAKYPDAETCKKELTGSQDVPF
jgi:hypothetical protein